MTTITTLADLCEHFGTDTPRSLNRAVYKATECGASLSVQLQEADVTCRHCEQFYARFVCGAATHGECDCPKCQGYCTCHEQAWVHNGDTRWNTLPITTPIEGFTIQTIVEGSEATVDSDTFTLPIEAAVVDAWIADMEAEADRLWQEANGENDDQETL
jgi:hypothetical protein